MLMRGGPVQMPTGGGISGSMPRPMFSQSMPMPAARPAPMVAPRPMMGAPMPGAFGSLGAVTGLTGGMTPGNSY